MVPTGVRETQHDSRRRRARHRHPEQRTLHRAFDVERLRYIKDPDWSTSVAPEPAASLVVTDVPDLRILSNELWQKVKTRQQIGGVRRRDGARYEGPLKRQSTAGYVLGGKEVRPGAEVEEPSVTWAVPMAADHPTMAEVLRLEEGMLLKYSQCGEWHTVRPADGDVGGAEHAKEMLYWLCRGRRFYAWQRGSVGRWPVRQSRASNET